MQSSLGTQAPPKTKSNNSTDNWQGFCRAYARQFNISYAASICEAGPAWQDYKKMHGLEFKYEKKAKTPLQQQQSGEGRIFDNAQRSPHTQTSAIELKKQSFRKEGKRLRPEDIPLVVTENGAPNVFEASKKKRARKGSAKKQAGRIDYSVYSQGGGPGYYPGGPPPMHYGNGGAPGVWGPPWGPAPPSPYGWGGGGNGVPYYMQDSKMGGEEEEE